MDSKLRKEDIELVGRRVDGFEGEWDCYIIEGFLLESWEKSERDKFTDSASWQRESIRSLMPFRNILR